MSSQDDDDWSAWFTAEAWAEWLETDPSWGPWLQSWSEWLNGPRPPSLPPISDVDAWIQRRQARSTTQGVWPSAVERLVRHHPGRSPMSIVFLHGFGASRGGGEFVVDQIAKETGSNIYYARLPGHGRTAEDHANVTAHAYIAMASEALAVGCALGERVLIVGSSTGGLLATWLASMFPDQVTALVLASPLFAFADPSSVILQVPGGIDAVEAWWGSERDASFGDDPEHRRLDGYGDRWLTNQRYRALAILENLRQVAATDTVLRGVKCPVLLLYSPNDMVVSLDSMHRAFGRMGPHRHSRFVPIQDGHHILLSEYVRTDKALIIESIREYLRDLGEFDTTSP
jgi:pimeloyl-ACP methyl ester carboxylesterase